MFFTNIYIMTAPVKNPFFFVLFIFQILNVFKFHCRFSLLLICDVLYSLIVAKVLMNRF